MLEMLTPMKAKLIDHKTLSKKNRPADEKPGVKLTVEQQLPCSFLDYFDPKLKLIMYEKAAGAKSAQQSLDGVAEATDTPNMTAIAQKLGKVTWHHDMTGYGVTISRGLGAGRKSKVELDDAILCNWRLAWKEGGTFIARFDIEAGNIPGDAWETFAELKSREFEITAKAPELLQRDIEDPAYKVMPAAPRKPGAADRAAVDKVKGAAGTQTPHKEPSKAAARVAAEKAFTPVPTVTTKSPAGSRTARGREATAKALAEGESAAAAGEGKTATDQFIDRHTADAAS